MGVRRFPFTHSHNRQGNKCTQEWLYHPEYNDSREEVSSGTA
jgi:hypothetical protein